MRWNAFKSTLSTQINVYQTLFYNQQHSDVIKVVEAKERKKRSVEPSARFRWERKNGNWKWCDGIVFGMEKFSQASMYLHTVTNYFQFAEWLFNWKKRSWLRKFVAFCVMHAVLRENRNGCYQCYHLHFGSCFYSDLQLHCWLATHLHMGVFHFLLAFGQKSISFVVSAPFFLSPSLLSHIWLINHTAC